MTVACYRWRLAHAAARIENDGPRLTLMALVAGAVIGGFGAGTFNLWLSGRRGLAAASWGRSPAPSPASNSTS